MGSYRFPGRYPKGEKRKEKVKCLDSAATQFAMVSSLDARGKEQAPSAEHPDKYVTFVLFGVILVKK